jgi:ABC-type nitrate/sulfonate/bicarbonate transport system substrate-binding protein
MLPSHVTKLAAFAATLAAVLGGPADAEMLKVHLAQNLSPISGITIVAQSKGFFAKHGLNIDVSNFSNGKQCLDSVVGGGADIATTAETPTTAAAMAKQPIAFLARMEYSDDETVVGAGSGINSKAGLKGKKIAFTAGTGSEIYTATLLKETGLTPKDVTLINLRPEDMLPALSSGSIDAMDTWEPYISKALKVLGANARQLDTKGVYSETFNIVVMKPYLETHQKLMEEFLAAMIDAETWMKAHPKDAIATIAKAAGMKDEDLSAIWDHYVFHVSLDDKQIGILKKNAEWRLASGNHPPGATMPDFLKVIDPGPLQKIDPSRVTYHGS